MMLNREEALLTVIDIQGNLYLAMDEKEFLLANTAKLIKGIEILEIPIVLTEQVNIGPTISDLAELMPTVKPIIKNSFSCCGDEQFLNALITAQKRQILVCGIEAHVCAYQTSMDLMERGYEVYVVADAVSSRTARNREIGIKKLLASGAILTSAEMALFELLKTATDPKARELFRIIK
jgi:nicotinamidase-related amidase